ncbi:hypothetical protein ACIA59_11950 [Micromonospora haikouensis]|uniref:hypothetical protein n=1 Tax=Micromonospora haikouensis TaxID=686309 RepID=UPI0037980926
MKELFLLAGSADRELADVVFAEADKQADHVPGLPLVVLRAATAAANRIGDRSKAVHYLNLRDAEQQRIDAEMAMRTPDSDNAPSHDGTVRTYQQ